MTRISGPELSNVVHAKVAGAQNRTTVMETYSREQKADYPFDHQGDRCTAARTEDSSSSDESTDCFGRENDTEDGNKEDSESDGSELDEDIDELLFDE